MAFTERQEYKIEVMPPYSALQVRRADIIDKTETVNGKEVTKEVGRTYHRHVCNPGDNVSTDCAQVQAIAGALWTDEVVAAYKAMIAGQSQS